jgi:hypothetical protein
MAHKRRQASKEFLLGILVDLCDERRFDVVKLEELLQLPDGLNPVTRKKNYCKKNQKKWQGVSSFIIAKV